MARKLIDQKVKDETVAKYRNGAKVPDLAKRLNVSEIAVYNWIKADNLVRKPLRKAPGKKRVSVAQLLNELREAIREEVLAKLTKQQNIHKKV